MDVSRLLDGQFGDHTGLFVACDIAVDHVFTSSGRRELQRHGLARLCGGLGQFLRAVCIQDYEVVLDRALVGDIERDLLAHIAVEFVRIELELRGGHVIGLAATGGRLCAARTAAPTARCQYGDQKDAGESEQCHTTKIHFEPPLVLNVIFGTTEKNYTTLKTDLAGNNSARSVFNVV